MPYKITRGGTGFFVYNPETKKHYSKRPLTLKKAEAQRTAIILSEHPNMKDRSKYYL